jgi:hypothetical protein
MPILPDRRDGVGTDRHDRLQAGGGGIADPGFKHGRIGSVAHLIVPAAAFSAWTTRPHQGERIPAGVPVIPLHDQFFFFAAGCDGCGFHNELRRGNDFKKILSGPARPGCIVGSGQIPPVITVGLFRAFCHQENLRIEG